MTFYKFAKALVSGFFRTFYRVHVSGEENIPNEGAVIIAPNHTSAADPIILGVITERQIHFMAKAELFFPPLGAILRALGAFPVHRKAGDVVALKTSLSVLSEGDVLCVFPQGTRCPGVELRDTADSIKSGVGLMAMRSGASVVPVYFKTKGNKLRMFRRNDVIFGEVIKPEEFSAFEGRTKYSDAASLIFDRICSIAEKENASL